MARLRGARVAWRLGRVARLRVARIAFRLGSVARLATARLTRRLRSEARLGRGFANLGLARLVVLRLAVRLHRLVPRLGVLARLETVWRVRGLLGWPALEAELAAVLQRGLARALERRNVGLFETAAAEVCGLALRAARRLAAIPTFRPTLALPIVAMPAASASAAAPAATAPLRLLAVRLILTRLRLALALTVPCALPLRLLRRLALIARARVGPLVALLTRTFVAPVAAIGMHSLATAVATPAAAITITITIAVPVPVAITPVLAVLRALIAIPVAVSAARVVPVRRTALRVLRASRGRGFLGRGRRREPAE